MKVCGIELTGNDAVICLLELDRGLFAIPDCRYRKLSIHDANDSEQLKKFVFTFNKLVDDYKIDQLVIRQRPTKGKFAGGAVGFKLEAVLQTGLSIDVNLISINPSERRVKAAATQYRICRYWIEEVSKKCI